MVDTKALGPGPIFDLPRHCCESIVLILKKLALEKDLKILFQQRLVYELLRRLLDLRRSTEGSSSHLRSPSLLEPRSQYPYW